MMSRTYQIGLFPLPVYKAIDISRLTWAHKLWAWYFCRKNLSEIYNRY